MTNIHFVCDNLNAIGRMPTKSEREFNNHIDKHYAEQAVDAARALREKVSKITSEVNFGIAILHAIETTPRYCYIKNCDTHGRRDDSCDVEIDLLKRTYSQIEHD